MQLLDPSAERPHHRCIADLHLVVALSASYTLHVPPFCTILMLKLACLWGAGREGVGAIFLHAPQLMLCKPIASDRWDRRAVELAAFWLVQGHTSVPEVLSLHAACSCAIIFSHACHSVSSLLQSEPAGHLHAPLL